MDKIVSRQLLIPHFTTQLIDDVMKVIKRMVLQLELENVKFFERSDFIAVNIGETSIKTKSLLENNVNNILIVVDFYSSRYDTYSYEALYAIWEFSEKLNVTVLQYDSYCHTLKPY